MFTMPEGAELSYSLLLLLDGFPPSVMYLITCLKLNLEMGSTPKSQSKYQLFFCCAFFFSCVSCHFSTYSSSLLVEFFEYN